MGGGHAEEEEDIPASSSNRDSSNVSRYSWNGCDGTMGRLILKSNIDAVIWIELSTFIKAVYPSKRS